MDVDHHRHWQPHAYACNGPSNSPVLIVKMKGGGLWRLGYIIQPNVPDFEPYAWS